MTTRGPGRAWTPEAIGDLTGTVALVTGPSPGGLGFHIAQELLVRGARVLVAGRSPERLTQTREALLDLTPKGRVDVVRLDLADLASVREGAGELRDLISRDHGGLDLLVNNAGVMATPATRTVDGLDLQMATNHFGPFLLTGLLHDLVAARRGRVVTVSSALARSARSAPLAPPGAAADSYRPWQVYAQSKLANLLFTVELDRRSDAVLAFAAHPGLARTRLFSNARTSSRAGGSILDATVRAVGQTARQGAQPVLMAATADLPAGCLVGPGRRGELSGPPRQVAMPALALDAPAARSLWELSEATTGLAWP